MVELVQALNIVPSVKPKMKWPLQNISIIDFSQNVAGPYAAMILAELGAKVTKVESPTGDPTMGWGPPFWDGYSPTYLALNRNKTKVVVNLKTAKGRRSIRRLMESADAVIVSSRPEALKRLRMDYASVRKEFPHVVYAELTAFGRRGPRASQPGYDPLMQALGGIMSVTGRPDGEPTRVGVSIIDMAAGMWLALGTLSALEMRKRTKAGHLVSVSLYETSIAWMAYHIQSFFASGISPVGWGSGTAMISPYEAFPTSDGDLVIAAGNDNLFHGLCKALGHERWFEDDRFHTNANRVLNRSILKELIASVTRNKPSEYWTRRLDSFGVPTAPILGVGAVATDPQLRATGIIQRIHHGKIKNFKSVGLPLTIDGQRPPLRLAPPK